MTKESGSADPSSYDEHIAAQKASNAARGEDVPRDVEMEGSSCYNPKRQEFDPEFDNDAEKLVAELEFNDSETEEERELKLRMLRIYSKRLDERNRRKDFILERNLLHTNRFQFQKDLTPEEMTICRKYDTVMRLHTKEVHDEFLRTVISEHRTRIRLEELKESRAAGCRDSAEADRYLAHKRIREAEADRNLLHKRRREAEENALMSPESACNDLSARDAGPATSSYVNGVDATRYYGADLLSEPEKHLCCELKLPAAEYLNIQEKLYLQILCGNISSKSDAHRLFKMDTHTTDMLYDMFIKKGIASP